MGDGTRVAGIGPGIPTRTSADRPAPHDRVTATPTWQVQGTKVNTGQWTETRHSTGRHCRQSQTCAMAAQRRALLAV
jgi:hypothetical protein